MAIITKDDCLKLLFDLREQGVECDKEIKHLLVLSDPDVETISFINSRQELNLRKFYEKLRRSYNDKKSKLYKNIVDINTLEPKEVPICLASLQLQILLFNKNLDDPSFLTQARFKSITQCLNNFYLTGDLIPCQKLLNLFRVDLKFLEEISVN